MDSQVRKQKEQRRWGLLSESCPSGWGLLWEMGSNWYRTDHNSRDKSHKGGSYISPFYLENNTLTHNKCYIKNKKEEKEESGQLRKNNTKDKGKEGLQKANRFENM